MEGVWDEVLIPSECTNPTTQKQGHTISGASPSCVIYVRNYHLDLSRDRQMVQKQAHIQAHVSVSTRDLGLSTFYNLTAV